MNLIFKILVCLFLLNIALYPQTESFEKVYSLLDGNISGHQIISINDHEIMIAGYSGNSIIQTSGDLRISKIDTNGNLIFVKSFPSDHFTRGITKPLLMISENEFWLITTGLESGEERIKLIRIDGSGNTIGSKIFSGGNQEFGFDLVKNEESILLVGAKKEESTLYNKLVLINVDLSGEQIWRKEHDFESSGSFGYVIRSFNDTTFAVAGYQGINFFNISGELINSFDIDQNINSMIVHNDNIITGGTGHVSMYDNSGSLVWSYDGGSTSRILTANSDGRLAIYSGSFRSKNIELLDENGNILSSLPVRGEVTDMVYTGESYFGTGYITSSTYLIKLDNEYNYSTVDLINPDGNERYIVGQDLSITIEWYSYGIEAIDIEFSKDNGQTWELIEQSIPAVDETYQWELPEINSETCLIKLTGNPENSNYDISTGTFSISPIYSKNYNFIAANEILMWIGNDGESAHNPHTDGSGLYWPGGITAKIPAVFADGILWGGKVDREIRVNGATYRYGLSPGPILEDGTADDPDMPNNKVYKLKEGWESTSNSLEKEIYEYNYNNWPAEYGAPYNDIDGDGQFTRGIDEPEIIGDETLFYVSNDLDSLRSTYTYGTLPIGIEYRQTVYAYNTQELQDAVFKKVTIINKGNKTVEEMYLAYWADDDLGFAGDDFVGCDTLLNLAYTYNGDNNDNNYYGEAPPAVGRIMLQGPVQASEKDTARVNGKRIPGYKNLPLVSHMVYIGGHSTYQDPELGTPAGSEQFYNNFRGLVWDGSNIINPITSEPTKFTLSGNPVTGEGWYEGEGWPGGEVPDDRRSVFASGPFNFEPGDTQSVVFAIFLARGTDNINSVAKLKEKARELHEFWGNDIPTGIDEIIDILPNQFSLSQNYPNPFNPTTIIEYTIPNNVGDEKFSSPTAQVSLIVYDILGQKVATLVNTRQKPGSYKVEFNGSGFPSGLYFYELTSDNYSKTNKMILMK